MVDHENLVERFVQVMGADGRPEAEPKLLTELLRDQRSVVLLGDPGMGKTTALKEVAGAVPGSILHRVQTFVFNDKVTVPAGSILVLDALDEAMAAGVQYPLGAVFARLQQIDLPRFWLSCRAVDWAGTGGSELLKDVAPTGLAVAWLLPFADEQIAALADAKGLAGADVIQVMSEAGLMPLLRNPGTLNLVLELARAGRLPPRSRWELFEQATELLTRERRERPRPTLGSAFEPKALLDAAGCVCASLLLSGESVVATGVDGSEPAPILTFAPIASSPLIEAALRTRLFTAAGEEQWQPTHRTIAEFLGAQFLAERISNGGLPASRVVALVRGTGNTPHPSLRGLFAWLVTLLSQQAEQLVTIDPYGTVSYGDPARLPPAALRGLLAALDKLAQREPWFRSLSWAEARFEALATPELIPDLRRVLKERPARPHLLSCVCDALARGEPRPELGGDLEQVLADHDLPTDVRRLAVRAYLRAVTATPNAPVMLFRRMLAQPTDDADVQVAGSLFLELYPSRLSTEDVTLLLLRFIASSGDNNSLNVARRLPSLVPSGNEADLLDALAACPWALRNADPLSRLAELQGVAGVLIARAVSDPNVDAPRILGWSRLLWAHYARGHDRMKISAALNARPDLFVSLLLQTTETLSPDRVAQTPHDVLETLQQTLPSLWPWPDSAPQWLFAAAKQEANPARAGRLFAASLTAFFRRAKPEPEWFEEAWSFGWDRAYLRPVIEAACGPVQIPDWHAEQHLEAARLRALRETQNSGAISQLRERDADIQSGGDHGALAWLALRWFATVPLERGLEQLPPRERLLAVSDGTIALSAERGFRALAKDGHCSTPTELAERSVRGTTSNLDYALLAGADLLFADAGEELPPLHPDRLASLVCVALSVTTHTRLDNTLHQDQRPWIGRVVSQLPEACSQATHEFIGHQLKAGLDHVGGLEKVCADDAFAPIRPLIIPDLLDSTRHPYSTRRVMEAALASLPREEVHRLVLEGVERTRDRPLVEHWEWLHAAWRLDPTTHETSIRRALDADHSLHIKLADATGETLGGHGRFPVALQLAHRQLIMQTFGPHYPPMSLTNEGFGIPDSYQIHRVIAMQLERLSMVPDEAARMLLAEVIEDPAMKGYHDHALQCLAVWQREADLRNWERPSVAAVVAALCSGPPASTADLIAFAEDHLRQLNEEMRTTEANPWHEFWNVDRGSPIGPKLENDSRDGLVRLLRSRFEIAGVSTSTEVRRAGDDRCDIVAISLGCRLPIEVKCDWHSKLWSAWKDQLSTRYACEPGAAGRGIYLVLWFGPQRGKGRNVRAAPDGMKPTAADELERKLTTMIVQSGLPIRVVVVDVTPYRPHRPAAKRKLKRTGH